MDTVSRMLKSGRSGRAPLRCLHDLNVADLLEREVAPPQSVEAQVLLRGQVLLVTGAAGSIGSELCKQLLNYEPALVIGLDTNETGLFDLSESLSSHPHVAHFVPRIGDINDTPSMGRLFEELLPHMVFHAAAYKHVPLLEQHPDQAARTNALATYRLCLLAQQYAVRRFVFISSDKAAEPVSVLGASKRIGEMTIQSLAQSNNASTCFCAVRFGNVIGSRGSVVPVFARQIEHGGPVTVTHPEATRYFMTIPEACGLVIVTSAIAEAGRLYMLEMGTAVRIQDLAAKMIQWRGLRVGRDIEIVYTGLRPGERLHETLAAAGEKLVPTAHNKIYGVMPAEGMLLFSDLEGWMDKLEQQLQQGRKEQVRAHLFDLVREQALIVTG